MTLRWTAFESMGPLVGIEKLLHARTVEEIHEGLSHVNWIMLNFVFGDTKGDIGWHVSSRLPIRMEGDGALPFAVKDDRDNWTGWVPWDEMPHATNPEKGWIGTCNHLTVKRDYPYYFSSQVSASYRYERLKQLLDTPAKKSADDHWKCQLDTLNLMEKRIGPLMAKALLAHEDTAAMGKILTRWDYRDDTDSVGTTVFQAVYKRFAWLVFKDELGTELAETMLDHWTYWQERLQKMVLEGESPWFDNVETKGIVETRDVLFHQAALDAARELKERLGGDMRKWTWGRVHRMEFVSPVRRKGFGKGLVGGGSHPFPGSVETLCRGMYDFNNPYEVTIPASLRMVADLSDEDRVMAVLPGGVSGRMFDSHTTDQIKAFVKGEKTYWWFSDKTIQGHARNKLTLTP
jgi:penicillin amidase